MKVALLIDEYRGPQAGTEKQLLLLAHGLVERGHAVRMGVLRSTPYTDSGTFPAPVDDLAIHRVRDPRGWRRLHRWGRRLRCDGYRVVQIFFNDAAAIGPWPLKLAGLKVVVSRRDMGFWYTGPVLAGLRLAAPAVSALVANSRAAGRAACHREWVALDKLEVIHNGLPPAPAAGGEAVVPAPRGGRIGLVANVRPVKRVPDLLQAFAQIAPHRPETDLVVVGGGDIGAARRAAAEAGVAEKVRFTGPVEHPQPWLRTFSVGVLCSASEGFPNAIMEYMQAGLPVVATDTGGNPELVEHGRTGLLVPVAQPQALAAALGRLLSDRRAAAAMGRAGARKLQAQFSVERMVTDHLRLYQRLSGGAAAGAPAVSAGGPRR